MNLRKELIDLAEELQMERTERFKYFFEKAINIAEMYALERVREAESEINQENTNELVRTSGN